MKGNTSNMPVKKKTLLYERIRQILESARTNVARTVNTTQVVANWLIGREIVEEEQKGKKRAGYGEELLKDLSERLTKDYEKGWSVRNLEYCRNFYLEYPVLLDNQKSNALRSICISSTIADDRKISNAVSTESKASKMATSNEIGHALHSEPWQPGQLNPNLSWTHYRTILVWTKQKSELSTRSRPSKTTGRRGNWNGRLTAFYMNGWPSARTRKA